ncbi:RHS repeat domain-containing protein, partial [Clostridium sp. DJ247]|uniref:RHS repeat domain-containing protein n=1 Tax=Clostridium sp. DJ247 TaxID=2726188 RepID=UPI001628D477
MAGNCPILALSFTPEYTYNSLNLLSQIKDPVGEVMACQYDRQGRLSRHIDRNNNKMTIDYDDEGNIKTITSPGG